MSWLDPERLAALYGKKPLKKADAALHARPGSAEIPLQALPKKKKKELKAEKKAEKKARKKLEKQAKKLQEPKEAPIDLSPDKKAKCCKKYKKGKQCDDCPLLRIKANK